MKAVSILSFMLMTMVSVAKADWGPGGGHGGGGHGGGWQCRGLVSEAERVGANSCRKASRDLAGIRSEAAYAANEARRMRYEHHHPAEIYEADQRAFKLYCVAEARAQFYRQQCNIF